MHELMDPLVGHPEQARRVPGTHFKFTAAQQPHSASGGKRRAAVFPIRTLSQGCIGPDRLHRSHGQFHVVDELGRARTVNEQIHRFPNAPSGFVDGPTLRVTAAHLTHGSHPPARLVAERPNQRSIPLSLNWSAIWATFFWLLEAGEELQG